MAECKISNDFLHKSLKNVPKIDHSYIYSLAKENSPVKENVTRGYKIFSESYIYETEGKCHRYKFDRL